MMFRRKRTNKPDNEIIKELQNASLGALEDEFLTSDNFQP